MCSIDNLSESTNSFHIIICIRENPEFLQYLTELGNLGADRLAVEPDTIAHQLTSVQVRLTNLLRQNIRDLLFSTPSPPLPQDVYP